MGEAKRIRGHLMKWLGEQGLLGTDRRLIARCAGTGQPEQPPCPCYNAIGMQCCAGASSIDEDDAPPDSCPLRKAAIVLCLDPEAR